MDPWCGLLIALALWLFLVEGVLPNLQIVQEAFESNPGPVGADSMPRPAPSASQSH